MQCKNDYIQFATMAIMALTIFLTAYQYHEYRFFTLKIHMHANLTLRRFSAILCYIKLDFLKIRMRRKKSLLFLISSQVLDLINRMLIVRWQIRLISRF